MTIPIHIPTSWLSAFTPGTGTPARRVTTPKPWLKLYERDEEEMASQNGIRILTARCHCKAIDYTIDLPETALPLPVHLCHCSICRHTHGTLVSAVPTHDAADSRSSLTMTVRLPRASRRPCAIRHRSQNPQTHEQIPKYADKQRTLLLLDLRRTHLRP